MKYASLDETFYKQDVCALKFESNYNRFIFVIFFIQNFVEIDSMVNTLQIKIGFLLALIITCSVSSAYSALATDDFIHISTKSGLSNNKITCLIQDKTGYIWIGTDDGLNRYDGYDIKIYRNVSGDSSSISGNQINKLFIDSKDNLWIGTKFGGLCKYEPNSDGFIRFQYRDSCESTITNNTINAISEDENQNLWVGTNFGLNKININTLQVTKYFTDVTVNMSQSVQDLQYKNGLPRYIIKQLLTINQTEYRNSYLFEKAIESTISIDSLVEYRSKIFQDGFVWFSDESRFDESISSIQADKKGGLWICAPNFGVIYYNIDSEQHQYFTPENSSLYGKDANTVDIVNDDVIIGGSSGWIDRLDMNTSTIHHIHYLKNYNVSRFINNSADAFVYIAGGKLFYYKRDGEQLLWQNEYLKIMFDSRLKHYNDNFKEIAINDYLKDSQSNIWLGTNDGLFLLEKYKAFDVTFYENLSEGSLSGKSISTMYYDSDGNIWIGYHSGNIDVYSPDGNKKKSYKASGKENLGVGTVFAIYETSAKEIYIGTYFGGLQKFDKKYATFVNIKLHPDDRNHANTHDVRAISEDQQGKLWITLHGGGVSVLKEDSLYARYRADYTHWRNSLHHDWLTAGIVDRNNQVWIASAEGISVFSQSDNTITSYKPGSGAGLKNGTVHDFLISSTGTFWIATNGGLFSYNYKQKRFDSDNYINSELSGSVISIIEDRDSALWLGTSVGIIKYDPDLDTGFVYSSRDGVRNIQPYYGTCIKDAGGNLYFGGENGYVRFDPSSIQNDTTVPHVVISNLKIFHKTVPVALGEDAVLKTHISKAESLVLEHKNKVITFEFVAFNYIQTNRNRYKYILEGFDDTWHDVGDKREATYTNIPPGTYTFRVAAANHDGYWNVNDASIEVVLNPAWWMTWWFKAVVAFLALFSIILIYKLRTRQMKNRNMELEAKVTERTLELQVAYSDLQASHRDVKEQKYEIELQKYKLAKKNDELKESNSTKVKMLSIIAHDVKNPMGALMGLSDLLDKKLMHFEMSKIQMFTKNISSSAQSVYNLLENLLTWARSQTNNIELHRQPLSVLEVVSDIARYQSDNLSRKDITFNCDVDENHIIYADKQTTETIIRNIFSNAIKFTPKGGTITVSAQSIGNNATVTIQDSGLGMSPEKIETLFKVDSNRSTKGTENETGTGLGLIICNEFAQMNNAVISVSSKVGEGSCFSISFPLEQQ